VTQCPYCLEIDSHAVNCWAPHGGPGGESANHSMGRATPLSSGTTSPSGPFDTGTTDGLINSLEARIEELEQEVTDLAGAALSLKHKNERIAELEKQLDEQWVNYQKALLEQADRIAELEGALREIEAKCRELADDGIGPVARDHLEIARIARAALRSDTP
jgi:hypothetical protein